MKRKKINRKQDDVGIRMARVLILYAKTQLLLIILVTILSWFVLSALNVQYPLILALITGSAAVVPVLGMTVSAVIAGVVAVLDGTRFLSNTAVVVDGIAVVIAYGVINVVVDYFLTPYVIGKTIGIHPVLLLGCVIFGAASFGILGALFTVPVVLVVKVLIDHAQDR